MADVRWYLWEGSELVLTISAPPADVFTTVTYEGGGWPRAKRYRAFEYTPTLGEVHAQLESELHRIWDGR